jgi:hypothetical protein
VIRAVAVTAALLADERRSAGRVRPVENGRAGGLSPWEQVARREGLRE